MISDLALAEEVTKDYEAHLEQKKSTGINTTGVEVSVEVLTMAWWPAYKQ